MDLTKGVQPVTAFRNHSAEFLAHLRETGRAITLTRKSAALLQDAKAWKT